MTLAAEEWTTRIAGEVKGLDTEGLVLKKWEKRIDDVIKYMLVAGKKVGPRGAAAQGNPQ